MLVKNLRAIDTNGGRVTLVYKFQTVQCLFCLIIESQPEIRMVGERCSFRIMLDFHEEECFNTFPFAVAGAGRVGGH